ncbi:MAG: hypothetical protein IT318_20185 [Anaerolineales bacterium]|nr:hypothetical protein [Anaerolineales bacterium]
MTTAVTTTQPDAQMLERVLVGGDLSKLTAGERLAYYRQVCESLSLNPLTKPFDYIQLNGRLVLYAGRNCTDQLRATRRINLSIVAREKVEDVYVVTARAIMPDGRHDESIGAVPLGNLKGEALANAMMKCETKAKRRATLSICGLSWADESEVPSIPNAQPVTVDATTGEIVSSGFSSSSEETKQEPPSTIVTRLAGVLGWQTEDIAATVRQMYDGRTFRELTPEEKRAFISYLEAQIARLNASRPIAAEADSDAGQEGLPF